MYSINMPEKKSAQSPDVVLTKARRGRKRPEGVLTPCCLFLHTGQPLTSNTVPLKQKQPVPLPPHARGQTGPARPTGLTGVGAAARARLKNTARAESLHPGAPSKLLQSLQWEAGHAWIRETRHDRKQTAIQI